MACLACGGSVTATGVCETCDADQKEIVSQPNDPATLVLELASDRQRLLYRFKRAWRDGTHAVLLDPPDFIARLVALIPPPRFHLLRYHGVLAAHAKARSEVVAGPAPALDTHSDYARLPTRWEDLLGTQSTSKRTCNIVAELAADAIFALEAAAPHVVRASDEYGLVASGTVHYHTIAPISFAFSGGMTVSVKSGPEVKIPTSALTRAGVQLLQLHHCEPADGVVQWLTGLFPSERINSASG